MAHSSKRKGSRIKQELVRRHKAAGIQAECVPLSGAAGGAYSDDLRIAGRLVAEVKARTGREEFKILERWLGNKDLLFLRRDYAEPLVLMPWAIYERLMRNQLPAFDFDNVEWPDLDDLELPDLNLEPFNFDLEIPDFDDKEETP